MGAASLERRKVDAPKVIASLENLTASQVAEVKRRYGAFVERGEQALEHDLFEGGKSNRQSSLTPDQRDRIAVLLRGTKGEPTLAAEGPDLLDALPPEVAGALRRSMLALGNAGASLSRLKADAIELHELLADDLDDPRRERVMQLHRRPLEEIDAMDAFYDQHYGVGKLAFGLAMRLKGLRQMPADAAARGQLGASRRVRDRGQAPRDRGAQQGGGGGRERCGRALDVGGGGPGSGHRAGAAHQGEEGRADQGHRSDRGDEPARGARRSRQRHQDVRRGGRRAPHQDPGAAGWRGGHHPRLGADQDARGRTHGGLRRRRTPGTPLAAPRWPRRRPPSSWPRRRPARPRPPSSWTRCAPSASSPSMTSSRACTTRPSRRRRRPRSVRAPKPP